VCSHGHRDRLSASGGAPKICSVNPGVYVLLGVAATGVFSIAKDMLVEGRREHAAREEVWRREMQDARVACLLIADELDTLALNFRLVAEKKRSPMRPIGESPFLSTREWHAGKSALARVIDQMTTWSALTVIYHDADSMRMRFLTDGPMAPVADDQAVKAATRAVDTAAASETLNEAAVNIGERLKSGLPRKRLFGR
jgi:hypothetical protein